MPIGVIVAVAIVCVVVAVLSSARRADEVALDHERQLFTRSLTNHGERVLREIASVATSEAAVRKIRVNFDPEWVQIYVGLRLQSFFDHDFVFVTDASDRFLYASLGQRSVDPNWFNSIQPDLKPVLDELARPRAARRQRSAPTSSRQSAIASHRALRAAGLSRPARHRGRASRSPRPTTPHPNVDTAAPIVLSVKFIDDDVLAEIASRLQLRNLRKLDDQSAAAGDYVFDLTDRGRASRSRVSPGRRSSPAPRSSRASSPSSRSRSPASRCSPGSCCATCGAPQRPSRPARAGCATSRCTIRCAACPTASSSASGSKR